MGQFSWFTMDTHHRIVNDEKHTVYLSDDKGNKWEEKQYEGYGVFGGKDFYELLAEMNGAEPDRELGICLAFGVDGNGKSRYPYGDNPNLKWPSITENGTYIPNEIPETDPDQGFEILDEREEEEDWV